MVAIATSVVVVTLWQQYRAQNTPANYALAHWASLPRSAQPMGVTFARSMPAPVLDAHCPIPTTLSVDIVTLVFKAFSVSYHHYI